VVGKRLGRLCQQSQCAQLTEQTFVERWLDLCHGTSQDRQPTAVPVKHSLHGLSGQLLVEFDVKQDKSDRLVIGDLRDDDHRPPVAAPNGNERLALFGDKEFRTQQSMVHSVREGSACNAAAAGDGMY
jgi:hypothetical protein